MRRVSVVGNSGSGKSRLARRIGVAIGAPYIELDAIHHLAGWQPIDPETFRSSVASMTEAESWVIDGNYRTVVVDGPVWDRADTVVWLDLPRATVMRQVTLRTLQRTVRREELWNGNREPLLNLWPWSHDSIVRWAWSQHDKYQVRYGAAMVMPSLDHLDFVRLRSRAEADAWVASLMN